MNELQKMKSVDERTKEIVVEFNQFSTVDEKYAHLFQLGEQLPAMGEPLKTESNRVQGCQSTLWFHLINEGGRFYLQADSDSQVIKGIAALLVRVIAGQKAEAIRGLSMDFIDDINIWKLPSARNNGLMAMLDHIQHQVTGSSGSSLIEGGPSHDV